MSTHTHTSAEGHTHSHTHPDDPASAEQAQLGPTSNGSVVLDIGGDVGSLVIMTSESLAGAEIEVSPVGEDLARTHIAIRERRSPNGIRWAGIFPGLVAGTYTVWALDGSPADTVVVTGGQVTQLDWR